MVPYTTELAALRLSNSGYAAVCARVAQFQSTTRRSGVQVH